MRKTLCAALAAVTFGGVLTPVAVQAQPPGYYYYDGRWVDQRQWHDYRDRGDWRRWDNRRRYRDRNNNDALAAGIIGFALGAAIMGSQNDANRAYARRDDRGHVARCSRMYRSYDPRSDTYLARDGYRYYCRS
jgi:hypothetical protein